MKHVLPRLFRPRKPASAGCPRLPPANACSGGCAACVCRSRTEGRLLRYLIRVMASANVLSRVLSTVSRQSQPRPIPCSITCGPSSTHISGS